MQTNYYIDDDILELKFNENPIVKEISQDWNIYISYDKDNNMFIRLKSPLTPL